MASTRTLALDPKKVTITKSDDGTLTVSAPITSAEFGTEGALTFTMTADMRLHVLWDGVGLTGFQAWSTQ